MYCIGTSNKISVFAITGTSTLVEFLPQVSSFKYHSQSEKQITTTEHITAGGMGRLFFLEFE